MKVNDAYIDRSFDIGSHAIVIRFENGKTDHIFHSIVQHCCDDLSLNELKEIRHMVYMQRREWLPDDVPPGIKQLYDQFIDVVENREKE